MMAASIRERKNETHLLRMVGASPSFLFLLFEIEAILICLVSLLGGIGLLYLCLFSSQNLLSNRLGLHLDLNLFNSNSLIIIASMILATVLVAAIPAFRAYRQAKSL